MLSAKGRFAFVASVDGAGQFSRYYPAGSAAAERLQPTAGLQLLPGAIELDETVGREWIVLLLSSRPLDETRVRDAVLAAWRAREGDTLGKLPIDAEAVVERVTKVER